MPIVRLSPPLIRGSPLPGHDDLVVSLLILRAPNLLAAGSSQVETSEYHAAENPTGEAESHPLFPARDLRPEGGLLSMPTKILAPILSEVLMTSCVILILSGSSRPP